jgi:hypothetical protein
MKSPLPSLVRVSFVLLLAAHYLIPSARSQSIPGVLETNLIKYHETLSAHFRAGETNLPLLRMDSFEPPVCACEIERSGKLTVHGSSAFSHWTDSKRPPLSGTNLLLLLQVVNALPPSAAGPIPLKQQVHVSGMRSNQWFHGVYNAQRLPSDIVMLYKLIGPPFKTSKVK